jgi:protein tyrosine/serine phosphatase
MIREEIRSRLFATSRPGYDYGVNAPVTAEVVADWIAKVNARGVISIICLLNEQHLRLYEAMPQGLLAAYRNAGFEVRHVPVVDHQQPPLSESELSEVERHFNELPEPILIHCSAGIDRTGNAVRHLKTSLKPTSL